MIKAGMKLRRLKVDRIPCALCISGNHAVGRVYKDHIGDGGNGRFFPICQSCVDLRNRKQNFEMGLNGILDTEEVPDTVDERD